jgi:hypothetical protein
VLKQGKPLAGVAVGAAQRDRNAETFVGDFQAATDAQGVFHVRNVPSGEVLALYGLLSSLRAVIFQGSRASSLSKPSRGERHLSNSQKKCINPP